jgi:hypothetical protein
MVHPSNMMSFALPSFPFLAQTHVSAMPVMLAVLCCMAIAYRYYSAFLAAKVAVLDDSRTTPAVKHNDGQNYHPTNKWVLFGHHFAAISGAGPLIGPVLAAQFGYMPGLLWIVIGVCLAGAMQDFLVMAASLRFHRHRQDRRDRRDHRHPVHPHHCPGGAGQGRCEGAGRGGREVPRRQPAHRVATRRA